MMGRGAVRPSRLLAALLVVALALLATNGASAQRRGAEAARARTAHTEAREHFYDASVLYEQGNLEGAIVEFEASYAIEPLPVVRFNLAQCLKGLFRYADAIEQYQRYLADSQNVPADRRAAVRATIDELRSLIAPITIAVAPEGAEVRIDGRTMGTAPLAAPLQLAAGRRVLEVVLDGHVTVRDEIAVVARRPRTIRVRLARQETAGTLRIRTAPRRALVRIDGLEVGAAPVERRVTAGGHVIEASANDFQLYRTSVQIRERQTLDLLATLEHEEAPSVTSRWWFWAGVSGVAAFATVLIIALWPDRRLDPIEGNVAPGIVTALSEF
jgi:hypothetical protein